MGTIAVPSLLGFGFWIIAARVFPTADVGQAAALVSAMLFVSVFTNLGLGQVFISRLASRAAGEKWSLTVTTGLAVTAGTSLLGGAAAAVVLPLLVPTLKTGLSTATFAILPLGVAGVACSLVLDYACIAERQARPAFVRNAVAAAFRLILIGVAAVWSLNGTTWILGIWAVSFLLIDVFAVIRVLPTLGHRFHPTLAGWKQEFISMRRLIAGHQSINLGTQASAFLLPVIVSARLGATENAYFYTTFMLATALFFVAPAISNSLFAEGAHHPEHLAQDLPRAARYIATIAGPLALALILVGPLMLGLFGPAYADAGSTLLLIFVCSAVLDAVFQLLLAVLRVRQQLQDGALATWVTLVLAIGATWMLLPPLGIDGAGVGWGLGKLGGTCVALFFVVRGPGQTRTRSPEADLALPRREP